MLWNMHKSIGLNEIAANDESTSYSFYVEQQYSFFKSDFTQFSVDLLVCTLPEKCHFWPQQCYEWKWAISYWGICSPHLCAIPIHVGCLYFQKKNRKTTFGWLQSVDADLFRATSLTNLYVRIQKVHLKPLVLWALSFHNRSPTCANICCPWAAAAVSAAKSAGNLWLWMRVLTAMVLLTSGGRQSQPARSRFQPAWSPTLARPARETEHR